MSAYLFLFNVTAMYSLNTELTFITLYPFYLCGLFHDLQFLSVALTLSASLQLVYSHGGNMEGRKYTAAMALV